MRYINQFREGMRVSDIYLVKHRQMAVTRNGREYASVILADKTGTADGKIWDLHNPGIEEFEVMQYVAVEADVNIYQGSVQLNIKRIRPAAEGEYNPADYMPTTGKSVKEMYLEITGMISSMKNPYLKKLCESYFVEDRDFVRRFAGHSAAKSIHHGFVGGLMEHTLSVMKICEFMAGRYPDIHRDLLITAALFHDIGKTKELSAFPMNDYTDEGQLIGHIIIGTQMVHERIAQIPDFPAELQVELEHCILAHHGELEYGSPKKPAILEALALSLADNMDAKIETMVEALNPVGAQPEALWMGFNRLFESNIRRTKAPGEP